jgi:hypothetical protein
VSTQTFTPTIQKQTYRSLSAKMAFYYLKAYQKFIRDNDLEDDSGSLSMSAVVSFLNSFDELVFVLLLSEVMAVTHYKS